MLAIKLACPYCQAVLKSPKPVPDGTQVTCPKCSRGFRAAGGAPSFQAGPPPAPNRGREVTAQPPPFRPIPSAAMTHGAASDRGIEHSSSDSGKRQVIVLASLLGGLVFIAILGGTLLWLLLRSGEAEPTKVGDEVVAKAGDAFILPPRVPIAKGKVKPLIVLTPEEEKKVQEMTDKGVDWLKKNQKADGTWQPYNGHLGSWPDGVTAMAGLTLLSCGVDARDPVVQKAAERIRMTGPTLNRTYEVALSILFLDKLGDARDKSFWIRWFFT